MLVIAFPVILHGMMFTTKDHDHDTLKSIMLVIKNLLKVDVQEMESTL